SRRGSQRQLGCAALNESSPITRSRPRWGVGALALSEFRKAKDFESLGTAFKRVVNIVKDHTGDNFSERYLVELMEKDLFKAFHEVRDKVEVTISEKNYIDSLTLMKNLKDPVDKFFDNVMVMDKDPKIKENRLSMLSEIKNLFFKIADFSKLSV
ncbi:MAG: DALR anticodon-binding domain-containing protein, partial [Thermodesulfobacteriota bacterium]